MKKFYLLLTVCLLSLGCFSIKYSLPSETQSLKENQKAEGKRKFKVWYFAYGLVPLNDNYVARMVEETNLQAVRVKTKMGLDDIFISLFSSWFTVIPTTVEVEGNGEKE